MRGEHETPRRTTGGDARRLPPSTALSVVRLGDPCNDTELVTSGNWCSPESARASLHIAGSYLDRLRDAIAAVNAIRDSE